MKHFGSAQKLPGQIQEKTMILLKTDILFITCIMKYQYKTTLNFSHMQDSKPRLSQNSVFEQTAISAVT